MYSQKVIFWHRNLGFLVFVKKIKSDNNHRSQA